jgi:transposase-like protein
VVLDAATLAAQLAEGRSIESIAREAGMPVSTVAYWGNKHGLTSSHAPRHAAHGGIERERLQELVEQGLSIRAMAVELDVSYTPSATGSRGMGS